MTRENLHQPMEIFCKKVKAGPYKSGPKSFFQMVYIVSGTGFIGMKSSRKSYKKGGLLLFTPNDTYVFDVKESTELLYIQFSNSFIRNYKWQHMDCLECLLYYAPNVLGCVMRNAADMELVNQFAAALLRETKTNNLYKTDLVLHFVNALIVIAARNIAQVSPRRLKSNADKRILDMVHYIQGNIFAPANLKAAAMAKKFGIAETYLGSYFKQQCGETIQEYIAGYRLRLIEHRLRFSDMRMHEIADEFGFTDESHLNKFFKKHKRVNLTFYRKRILEAATEI